MVTKSPREVSRNSEGTGGGGGGGSMPMFFMEVNEERKNFPRSKGVQTKNLQYGRYRYIFWNNRLRFCNNIINDNTDLFKSNCDIACLCNMLDSWGISIGW